MNSHAFIQQVGDILIIKLPTATLQIPLPKMLSVDGIIETVQVSSTLQEERPVDLVAQGGRFQIRDVDYNLLFDYEETRTEVAAGLQPAAELVEGSANISAVDPLFQDSTDEPQSHPPESSARGLHGANHQQGDVVTPPNSAQSLFIGHNSSTHCVNKRKIGSQTTSDNAQAPESKRRVSNIPLVPLENVDRKIMPVSERMQNRFVSQDLTPPSIKATPRNRGSSASAAVGKQPTAFTRTPKKEAMARNTNPRLPSTPPSEKLFGASSHPAKAGIHGVATSNKTPDKKVLASTTPKGFNSAERVFGKQKLVTKWKGTAHYNPNTQRSGNAQQISFDSLNLEENIRSYPLYDEPSPTASKGARKKGPKKSEKDRSVVGRELVQKPQGTSPKKADTSFSARGRENTEGLPTWMLKDIAESPAFACTNFGESFSVRKVKKDKVNRQDGKTFLGNGVGLESKTQVSRSTPMKGKENKSQHNAEAARREVASLSSSVFTIQGGNWASFDNEGETFDLTRGLPISHLERSCVSIANPSISKSSSTRTAQAAKIPPADGLPYGLFQQADGSVLKVPPNHRAPKTTGP